MRYYLIKKGNELHVMAVSPQQENAFTAQYGGQVIICGDSIIEALRKFDELPVIVIGFMPR